MKRLLSILFGTAEEEISAALALFETVQLRITKAIERAEAHVKALDAQMYELRTERGRHYDAINRANAALRGISKLLSGGA